MGNREMKPYFYNGLKNYRGNSHTPFILDKEGTKVYFLIRCSVCHRGLCRRMTIYRTPRRKENMIFVDPCPHCLEAAREGKEVVPFEMNGEYQTRERFDE